MSVILKTYNNMSIAPKDDACLYDNIIGTSGVIEGCTITHLGSNQLHITAGRGVIKGRIFTIEEETIYCTLSSSGTVNGRLKLHLDLSNTEEPLSFMTEAAAVLPDLIQNEQCNYENGVYEIAMATYSISESVITNLVRAYTILNVNLEELNEGLAAESTKVGVLSSLTTTIKTSIVNAINSLVSTIGTLSTALTTHKSSSDHDSRYYTESEIDTKLAAKQNTLTNPLTQSNVVNSLNSTSTVYPLSAAQGKALKTLIDTKEDAVVAESYTAQTTSDYVLVSKSGYSLISASSIRTDASYFVKGINYRSSGNYTIIVDGVSSGVSMSFWLVWVKN